MFGTQHFLANVVRSISACSLSNDSAIFDFLYVVTNPQKNSVPDAFQVCFTYLI